MVTIKKKRFIFSLTENYFGYKFKWSDLFLPASYNGVRKRVKDPFFFGIKKYGQTAVLFLDKPIEELFTNFSSSHKRYIKKAETEGVMCYYNKDRKGFIKFYNEFAKRKKLDTLDPIRLDEFSGDEWIYFYAVKNGQLLVAHCYLKDDETGIVRLMQSGSLRFEEQYDPGQIARANKLLHYFSINYFKDAGLHEYDFGGWAKQDSLLQFKLCFGAHKIDVLNYYTYLYLVKDKLKDLMDVIKRK